MTVEDRYAGADRVQDEGRIWIYPPPALSSTKPRADDRLHQVVEGDRIDVLAHRYFGDARLWWVICDYNSIFWMLDLEPGMVLRIPSFEHVHMTLLDEHRR